MRHLTVMVGVGAGDRQPDPASLAKAPSGRQQRDHDLLRPTRNERGSVATIAAVVRPACPIIRRAGRRLPVQRPQYPFGHVAYGAVGFLFGQIYMQRCIRLGGCEVQPQHRVSDEFDRGVERLGAVAGQRRLPRLPVIVIGADIVRSEPAIPGVRPGTEAEIAREAILACSRRR